MARGIRKYIIKSTSEALDKMRKIGAENITGVSGIHEAWNPETHETTPYYTVHYNQRAEFEISVPVMDWFVKKGIFQIDE